METAQQSVKLGVKTMVLTYVSFFLAAADHTIHLHTDSAPYKGVTLWARPSGNTLGGVRSSYLCVLI